MLHARDIHPFLPLLIVYTCSAMTHILDDIREDALKFMDLWVAAGGQVVVNGFWDKVHFHFCHSFCSLFQLHLYVVTIEYLVADNEYLYFAYVII